MRRRRHHHRRMIACPENSLWCCDKIPHRVSSKLMDMPTAVSHYMYICMCLWHYQQTESVVCCVFVRQTYNPNITQKHTRTCYHMHALFVLSKRLNRSNAKGLGLAAKWLGLFVLSAFTPMALPIFVFLFYIEYVNLDGVDIYTDLHD